MGDELESDKGVESSRHGRARILLVDDALANHVALRTILEHPGYDLEEAGSGEEALQRLKAQEFAVVLLGVRMPGLAGFETAKLIRANDHSRHTPIIFLSAEDLGRTQVEAGYALGAVDFLVAPFSPVVLQAKVRALVLLFQQKARTKQEAEQLRLIVQGTADSAIFMLDPQGRVVTWNAGAERLNGYRADEVIGRHFSTFYPQEVIESGRPAHELKVAADEGRFEDEGWRLRKDGSRFWAEVVITALRDERGQLVGFSKVTRDLSERKQAEESLRRSEERFRHMVEGVRDYAIFMLDPQGNVATWNVGAERIKQYTADEIIGQHFSKFYPEEVIERGWPDHELKVAAAEGRFEDEGWRVRKDGSQFWANVVITAIKDDHGQLLGFTKVTRDLTARKQAEESARRLAEATAARRVEQEERERLQITLASIGDAVITTDCDGRVTFLNPVAEELVAWTTAEAVGRGLEEVFRIVNESTRKQVENPAVRALREGKIVGLANHTLLISRDGTERLIDDSAAPIRNERGDISGSVLVFRDISERKRAERQRNARLAVTHALNVATTADDGVATVLEAVCEKLGWDVGFLWAVSDDGSNLTCRFSRHQPGMPLGKFEQASCSRTLAKGEGLPGRVWATLEPAWILEVTDDANFPRAPIAAEEGLRSAFACPMLVGDRFLGVIEFYARRIERPDSSLLEMMGTVAGAVAQFLERRRAEDRLREQTANAETLLRVGALLSQELDLHRLVQTVTDEGTGLCGAQFGAFFYNIVRDRGEAYTLYTLSGVPRKAFDRFPMPRNTALFGPTFRGEGVVRLADVTQDPRYGKSAPHYGMPEGHLPVKSYLAVPVVSRSGEVLGGLFFGHAEAGVFTAQHERLMVGIAVQAAVAIDNARLYQRTQATAERLNLALSAAQLGDWSWDTASDVVTLSERAAEVFGIPYGETITWSEMQALLHEDDRERVRQEVERVIAARVQYDIEYRINRWDGSEVWIGVLGRAIYDASDKVTGMYGVVQDITSRKRGEAVLAAQKRALEQLVRGAPLADVLDALCEVIETQAQDRLIATVLLVDEDGQRLHSVAGRRAPADYVRAVDGVAIGPCNGSCGTAAHRGEPVVVTNIAVDPLWADYCDAALAHGLHACWSTPILSSQGNVLGTFAVYFPTTRGPTEEERRLVELLTSTASVAVERRRDEAALRTSEEYLRAVVETTPACIKVVTTDGTLISMNSAGLRMVDARRPEDVLGGCVYGLICHEYRDAFRNFNERVCRGEPGTMEFEIEGLQGSRRYMETHAAPLRGPDGSLQQLAITYDITDRKRAEAALRESEQKFRLLADTIPQLAWMARPDGHIFWYNRRWYEYTGTTPEQMEGWGWESVHDPEVLLKVLERWEYSLATGEPFDMVFPLRGADGTLRPFLTRVNPLKDDEGRILYWFGTNTDITELRQTREALSESEERLRLALDAGRMGVWDWNVRTGELKWSDSLEPLHGLAPGTFGGTFEHFQQLVHPDDREAVHAAIGQALETGGEFYVEFRNIWPSGGIHWIAGSGKVFYGDDGQPLRMIGIGMDVTQRKRAEQISRFLADASAALSLLVDFESTLQKVASLSVPHFADWAAVDVLGENNHLRRVAVAHVDPAKVQLAHDLHQRFPPDPSASSGVWKILRTGQAEIVPEITDEMLLASVKDAELLGIMRELGLKSYIGVPLTVRGKTLGVLTFIVAESDHAYDETDLAVAKDLASRAAIAIENTNLYRELRDADRRKDEFLAVLAHELRNPLAPIRNGLQILRLAGAGGEMVDEARSMMERQLAHMVRLVDDLLDVSRITRNKLELRRERVALANVIHTAVETSRPVIEQFGHTFTITLPPTPVYLDADPVRLAQVLANLLNNAAKYTEPGGRIALTAETQGTEAVVRVTDNGLGIPTEALPGLFQMFSQVDRNMQRAQGGLGIGLTLVRRLVEMHGGRVEAHSAGPGQGSEFTVRLPVISAGQPSLDRTPSGPGVVVGATRRILVVDDNQDSAMSLGMMLRLLGNEVQTAHDGVAAVEAAEQIRPDVILLDIGLPKLNGYDACRRIREQPWSKGVVIVALTGWGQESDRRRSSEVGFDHHLVKPVDLAMLEAILRAASTS